MAELTSNKIKNVILLSHTGAGKTSLTDMLAYNTGISDRLGKVDEKTSVSDYTDDEKNRGMSINSSIFSLKHSDYLINLIDTPGYLEFIGEVVSGLKVADSGILLIDASSGVEIGTQKMWSFLEDREVPRMILINKLDADNIDFLKLVNEIKENFGKKCILFQIPNNVGENYKKSFSLFDENIEAGFDVDISSMREVLVEAIAETQDDLLEEYLEKGELSEEKLIDGLKLAIKQNKVVPIFCGSAHVQDYVGKLADYIIEFLPSSDNVKDFKVEIEKDNDDGESELEEKTIENKIEAPFCAQVFKNIIDPYIGQLSIFRIFSGRIKSNAQVRNVNSKTTEKMGQLYLLQGKEQEAVEDAVAGNIIAVAKLKNTKVSDTFFSGDEDLVIPKIKFPEPVLSYSISPESREDEKKISESLRKLSQEDQTFKVSRDQQTKEVLISGMGSLHLKIMASRLKERFGVNVKLGTPKVPYKETLTSRAKVQARYKKQTGGHGQFGEVCLELVPSERGKGFEFEDKITGGAIPRQYIPSVEKGIKNKMTEGVLAGYPLVDFKVILFDGSYHSVDSSDMAFQIAGAMALKDGIKKAKPVLLEPIMDVSVMVTEEFMGQVNKDLSSRRGRIMGMETKGSMQVVNAQVPLSEMLTYASELKSLTGGSGVFSMEFSHYEQLASNLAEKVITKSKEDKEKNK